MNISKLTVFLDGVKNNSKLQCTSRKYSEGRFNCHFNKYSFSSRDSGLKRRVVKGMSCLYRGWCTTIDPAALIKQRVFDSICLDTPSDPFTLLFHLPVAPRQPIALFLFLLFILPRSPVGARETNFDHTSTSSRRRYRRHAAAGDLRNARSSEVIKQV